ncbi:MAG: helix-turn-helix transcriptional regulator [Clostridia bacterium]|nr:helix-turn-helix transcriptional regulator [Clostridia bacterium]
MTNEEQIKNHFAKRLIELRKEKGITQLQLAESLNYSDKAVSKWERGESIPDAYTLLKIAKLFSVPLDFLLDCEYTPPEENSEEAEKTDEKRIGRKKAKHIFIPFISALGTYFIASVAFFVFKNIPSVQSYAPLAFQYATVAVFIVLTVFSSLWWKRIWQCVCVSGIIWSVGFCMTYPVFMENFKYFLIPCAILQCICILIFVFVHFLKRDKKD